MVVTKLVLHMDRVVNVLLVNLIMCIAINAQVVMVDMEVVLMHQQQQARVLVEQKGELVTSLCIHMMDILVHIRIIKHILVVVVPAKVDINHLVVQFIKRVVEFARNRLEGEEILPLFFCKKSCKPLPFCKIIYLILINFMLY